MSRQRYQMQTWPTLFGWGGRVTGPFGYLPDVWAISERAVVKKLRADLDEMNAHLDRLDRFVDGVRKDMNA